MKPEKSVDIGAHFHKHAGQYQEVVHGTNKELYENVRKELNQHLSGTVLDIGNGNVFNYDLARLNQVFAVDLAFQNMPAREKITYFTGDARKLDMIKDASCDFVVMQFLIHHIVDWNKSLTDQSIAQCFSECRRVLKPNGKLIIVEMLVAPLIEAIENLLYSLHYKILSLLNKPMVRFYSKPGLTSWLKTAGFQINFEREISMGKWIDPFEALFPGKIKLPRWLYPAECRLMVSSRSS